MSAPESRSTGTIALCPICKKLPGQKVGPPAMARCITPGCFGRERAAETIPEWNARGRDAAEPHLQGVIQQAIMAHPHFEGGPVLAYGLAGAALKAMPQSVDAAQEAGNSGVTDEQLAISGLNKDWNAAIEALLEIRRIANEPGDRRALVDRIYGIATQASRDLAYSSQEAREKEITRLATIQECAKVADDMAAAQRATNEKYPDHAKAYATWRNAVFCYQDVAKQIRALSLPSTDRRSCHDHPTRRCTPDDCCQSVSSTPREAPHE